MGHVIDYMVFNCKTPRKNMRACVEDWAKQNVDTYEHSENGNIWNIACMTVPWTATGHEDKVYASQQDAVEGESIEGFYDDHACVILRCRFPET